MVPSSSRAGKQTEIRWSPLRSASRDAGKSRWWEVGPIDTPAFAGSAPGDRGDDRHRLAIGHWGVEPLQVADVVVGHEDVHEPPQAAVLVEQSIAEARMGAFEGGDDLSDGIGVDAHLPFAGGEGAQRGGYPDRDAHRRTPSFLPLSPRRARSVVAKDATGPKIPRRLPGEDGRHRMRSAHPNGPR